MHKMATSLATVGVSLSLVGATLAARGGPGGVHIGGGGAHFAAPHFSGGHPGGAMMHLGGAPRMGIAHSGVAHIGAVHGGAVHFGHVGHIGSIPGYTGHIGTVHGAGPRFAHFGRLSRRGLASSHGVAGAATAHGVGPGLGRAAGIAGRTGPGINGSFAGAFAAHRHFMASGGAFRPFFYAGWHPYHHLGWIGPLFWPYAYGDFFYYALWPEDYAYIDPFWVYGYGDIYTGIFWPYDYGEYVRGRRAPARMAALKQQMAQSCTEEATEVTGWPIGQIQDAVKPDDKQTTLLDAFGNAVVQASDEIKSHCPTSVSFTPTSRLDEMQQRMQALVQAVDIVRPPLAAFYDSLSDEQKARFNDVGTTEAQSGTHGAQASNAPSPQAACDAAVMAWPAEQIERTVRPTDAQRAKLEALQSAAANAADTIKASCPSEIPSTPPARLEAVGKRLQAMLQAINIVRPALADFYDALSDDQKARFNTLGKELFAANRA